MMNAAAGRFGEFLRRLKSGKYNAPCAFVLVALMWLGFGYDIMRNDLTKVCAACQSYFVNESLTFSNARIGYTTKRYVSN